MFAHTQRHAHTHKHTHTHTHTRQRHLYAHIHTRILSHRLCAQINCVQVGRVSWRVLPPTSHLLIPLRAPIPLGVMPSLAQVRACFVNLCLRLLEYTCVCMCVCACVCVHHCVCSTDPFGGDALFGSGEGLLCAYG